MKVEDYFKNKNNINIKSHLINFTKKILICASIVLSVLITCNLKPEFKEYINKNIFESNFNFSKINSFYNKYLFSIKKETDKVTSLVTKNNILDYTKEEKYLDGVLLTVGENYPVKALESGLVVSIGKTGDMDSIKVQQSNGIDVIYANIETTDIKVYDYIEKENIIGKTNNENLYLSFSKDGKVIDFEPYIKY